jgi:hypothetical protein
MVKCFCKHIRLVATLQIIVAIFVAIRSYMAKTSPIGVRFDKDMLEALKNEHGIDSPQKALNYLFDFWRMNTYKTNTVAEAVREAPFSVKKEPEIKVVQPTEMTPFEAYQSELKAANSIEEIKKIVSVSAKDSDLSVGQKESIKTLGMQLSQNMDL